MDSELIEELQEMGPSAIAEIKALNSMSDSELEKYDALWSLPGAIFERPFSSKAIIS